MTLFERMTSYARLLEGWQRVEENDGAAGADGVSIYQFELRLEKELRWLEDELRRRSYVSQPLLRVEMDKKGGGVRVLGIPAVRDRVAQGAALSVLEPLIEAQLEETSYAYRRGRYYRDAIEHIRNLRDQGYRWVVDADITRFFDHVPHDLMLDRLRDIVPDADVLHLVQQWIAAPMVPRAHAYPSEYLRRTQGLPQGAVISPVLANLFLDHFDEAVAEKGFKLVRYADDFVILCKSRPRAEEALRLTETLLHDLELQLHPDKTRIVSFDEGFKYLGTLFVRSLIMPESEAPQDLLAIPQPSPKSSPDPTTTTPSLPPENLSVLGQALYEALREKGLTLETLQQQLQTQAGAQGMVSSVPTPEAIAQELPLSSPFMRTLYLHEQGCWLKKEGGRFVVTQEGRILMEIPTAKVEQVLVFGSCILSPAARRYCLKQSLPVYFLSALGDYYGHLASDARAHLAREALQYHHLADEAFRLDMGKRLVHARLFNQRGLLQRRQKEDEAVAQAVGEIQDLIDKMPLSTTLDEVRGYEGRGAALFFGVLDHLIQVPGFSFDKRTRRPPTDPMNAMLSFGYTLLFQNVYSMLHLHRLNPYLANLHSGHDYHPALASDMMEEFRMLIESMVLELINRKQVLPEDFYTGATAHHDEDDPLPQEADAPRPCLMKDKARKQLIKAFEATMHRPVTHPGTGYKVTYRCCIDLQVRAYVQHLEGGTPYQPFLRR